MCFYLIKYYVYLQECVTTATVEQMINGKYEVIIAHPEALFCTSVGRQLRSSAAFCEKVIAVVVDECHTVELWGRSFRHAYKKLKDLSAYFKCPIVALSATLTTSMWKSLPRHLGIRQAKEFRSSPDKPNMYYEVATKPPNMDIAACAESIYMPEIDALQDKQLAYPVTLCYMPLDWCADAQAYGIEVFGRPSLETTLYAFLFSVQDKTVVKTVTAELKKEQPRVRLVFCSPCVGMGFDAPSITRVIHAKPPRNVLDLVQQVGRAGRSGQVCSSLVYFNNNDIAKNVTGMTQGMRDYCTTEGCLRLELLKDFGYTERMEEMSGCKCCKNCRNVCECAVCKVEEG